MFKRWRFFLFLILVYLMTRLYHLVNFPIFCDEAIYIRWAQVLKSIHSLWWVPLSDGKQPLFMWLAAGAMYLFRDPLFAGRLISVLAGLGEMAMIWGLVRLFFREKKYAYFLAGLYIVVPFFLFFNRLALVDALLSFFITSAFYWSIRLARQPSWRWAFLLGISLGGDWLIKSPGEIFIFIVSLASLLLFVNKNGLRALWQQKKGRYFLAFLTVADILAVGLYNSLRLAPVFYMIARRNKDYLWSWEELRHHPWGPFWGHLKDSWRYYWHYLTPPVWLAAFGGIWVAARKKRWPLLLVLLLWWSPVLPMFALAKVFTARYILFSAVPWLVLAGLFLVQLWQYSWGKILALLAILPSLVFMMNLLFNPWQINLPADEYRGYLEDWTAGEGIRQIADYLRKLPSDEKVVVGTEGFFGTLPNGLQIYFDHDTRITVIGSAPTVKEVPDALLNAKKAGNRVFLVVNQSRFKIKNPAEQGLELIRSYAKPGGDKLLFWELKNVHKM